MNSDNKLFGQTAEVLAERHLRKKGYHILERNVRLPGGELDLIARHDHTLVFVEVKARRTTQHGGAAYAIHKRKEQQIIKLAAHYLSLRNREMDSQESCRFDVILCQATHEGILDIRHIENAFEVSGQDLRW